MREIEAFEQHLEDSKEDAMKFDVIKKSAESSIVIRFDLSHIGMIEDQARCIGLDTTKHLDLRLKFTISEISATEESCDLSIIGLE